MSAEQVDFDDGRSFATATTLVNPATDLTPSARPTKSGPRTLHVYRDSLLNSDEHYTIKDSDDETAIYVAEISAMTRPQIQIYTSAEYAQKGSRNPHITAKRHLTSSDIEIQVRNQTFYFVANGWIRQKYEWPSPAFGNNMLRWKRDFDSGAQQCFSTSDKKTILARWISAGWAPSKVAELQILTNAVSTEAGSPALEELLVTALANKEVDK